MKYWNEPDHIYFRMGLPVRHYTWQAAWEEIWGETAAHVTPTEVNVDVFYVYYEEEVPDG